MLVRILLLVCSTLLLVALVIAENTTYEPYGSIVSGGAETRFDYEAKEYDSVVGDCDFHFRKYNQEWGLFTQPDTLLPNVYDPQQLNRYSFERNNPYNRVDPDGHVAPVIVAVVYYGAPVIQFGDIPFYGYIAYKAHKLKKEHPGNKEVEEYFNTAMDNLVASVASPFIKISTTPSGWLTLPGAWQEMRDYKDRYGSSSTIELPPTPVSMMSAAPIYQLEDQANQCAWNPNSPQQGEEKKKESSSGGGGSNPPPRPPPPPRWPGACPQETSCI